MRGLMVDSQGQIIKVPIKNNLKNGLKSLEYFISCYGARKGVIDTALKTANSGYLTRKLVYVCENQFIKKPNCNTYNCQLVLLLKRSKKYYFKTLDQLLGRVLARSLVIKEISLFVGQDICLYLARKLMLLRKVYIRSPFTCKLNEGVCQLCYGWNLSYGRIVELGENVGIVAAQSISEPATQLTMRTFHTGGIFSGSSSDIIRVNDSGILYYNSHNGGKILKLRNLERCFFTLKSKNLILISNFRKRLIITLPRYSVLYARNGDRVFSKQVVAELTSWKKMKRSSSLSDLSTNKVKVNTIAPISGRIKSMDKGLVILHGNVLNFRLLRSLLCKNNLYRIFNFSIGIISKFSLSYFEHKLKKRFNIKIIFSFLTYKYFLRLSRNNSIIDSRQFYVYRIMYISTNLFFFNKKTGIKYVSNSNFSFHNNFLRKNLKLTSNCINIYSFQLLEFESCHIAVLNVSTVMFLKTKKVLLSSLIKKGDKLFTSFSSYSKSGDIVQGLPAIVSILENRVYSIGFRRNLSPSQVKLDCLLKKNLKIFSRKLAVRKSLYAIQKYLVNKIKLVYSQQNVKISDKHVELVVKQMTSKAIIRYEGDSNFVRGELVSLNKLEKINSNLLLKIIYFPLIIGITKLSLLNDSFLASSSFQQTFYTICSAALEGKCDWLHTLKGNIIVGNLIPAITGYNKYK
jgi:DNA-directed RNA polymerase subunit beta'